MALTSRLPTGDMGVLVLLPVLLLFLVKVRLLPNGRPLVRLLLVLMPRPWRLTTGVAAFQ